MSPSDETPRTPFPLFTTDGQARFALRLRDEGIAVHPDGITMARAGRWTRAAFTDIASVSMSTAVVGRSSLAQCTITLTSGTRIVVSNANASGLVDGQRNRDFRDFVTAFHAALVTSGAATSIAFRSGYGEGRIAVLRIALVAAGLMFVVLPIALLLITGDIKTLGIAIAGAFLFWPMARAAQINRPATYSPRNPPDLVG